MSVDEGRSDEVGQPSAAKKAKTAPRNDDADGQPAEPRMIKAIIFDLDGTLLDTEEATCDYIAEQLRPHGLSWTAEEHKLVIGTMHFFPGRVLDILGVTPERKAELCKVLPPRLTSPGYNAHVSQHAAIKPGAKALIRRFQKLLPGVPLGLCTSRRQDSFDAILEQRPEINELLEPLRCRVIGSIDPRNGVKVPSKPAPDSYKVCAELLGVQASECLVFEDAPSGIEAALASGAYTVAVPESWVEGDAEAERAFAAADLRLSSLADFEDWCCKSITRPLCFGRQPRLLVGCGNPTVDICCEVTREELRELGLKPGTEATGLDDAGKKRLVDHALGRGDGLAAAGGAALNAVRVAAWRGGAALRAAFVGSVGRDANAAILFDAMGKLGVVPLVKQVDDMPTAVCAALVENESRDRTLSTIRGAAAALDPTFVATPATDSVLREASLFYLTSFVLTSQPRVSAVEAIIAGMRQRQARVALNLSSAGLLPKAKEPVLRILPQCSFVFGNAGELEALGQLLDWGSPTSGDVSSKLDHFALRLAAMLVAGGVAVITAGGDSTLVADKDSRSVSHFKPPPVQKAVLVDTNGAGDAFVGGFLSEMLVHENAALAQCVVAGHECARVILQRRGCDLPDARPEPG
eukprot:TRINITY_DN45004_c0_g1_i1.p1 TRINITY_DN45004_c0_g1~~TRINITY_DN45004_c0_g1_i1.p1  ORF type:complete len:636 (-),score=134.50 TRINITY_DN45004_c0_g1_i1:63-1970(-)